MNDEEDIDVIRATVAYNPLHTAKFNNPPNLDEMRKKDPQGAINYLWSRKEMYKNASIKERNRLLASEQKIKELESKIAESDVKIKRAIQKIKEERSMKLWWQKATYITSFLAIIILVLLLFISDYKKQRSDNTKIPTSGTAQKTPNRVLASVNIYNGEIQGSGTVISKGEKNSIILSAGHNFKGVIGGEFWVYYADGTYTKATLLAVDRNRDLAIAKVDSSTIISHSYLPKKIISGEISGVGYTGGQGPNLRSLVYNKPYYNSFQKYMWEFDVQKGPFWDGDSGSGIFIDEALIGVTIQRDSAISKKLYACSHDEIISFLEENKEKLDGCGDYYQSPPIVVSSSDLPPPWKPNPNVPIYTENKIDKLLDDLKRDIEELKKRDYKKPSNNIDDGLKRPSEVK